MIPSSLALVPLLPERQAALKAIAIVEHAQQRGTRLARHPYAAAFMKQLSGMSRISVQGLNRIRGIYLRPREKRAPLPEWEAPWIRFSERQVMYVHCHCRKNLC